MRKNAGNFIGAYELMDVMGKEGFSPNIYTYNAIINSSMKERTMNNVNMYGHDCHSACSNNHCTHVVS